MLYWDIGVLQNACYVGSVSWIRKIKASDSIGSFLINHSTFHSLPIGSESSSPVTTSSTDQITSVRKMFIHLHQTWEDWSRTSKTFRTWTQRRSNWPLTQKIWIDGDQDRLPICQQQLSKLSGLRELRIRHLSLSLWRSVITGRAFHPSSTPYSISQLSAPIVGSMNDARWSTVRRYARAKRTGFGNVFVIKLIIFWMWGKILDNSGALWYSQQCRGRECIYTY